ncbi:hypothetical protein ACFY3U_17425 [Micromonospora sp. NPDC000089]|uniref:hypothetical protein n=1 Tax=unclassified Micromonospora TaxID=2617518 RepID=UPI0036B5E2CE
MSPFLLVFLVLVLAATSYAAGRLHGQLSYRIGYRFGYRQGYFDGDRGAWNRRRRDAQAAIASALSRPVGGAPATRPPVAYAPAGSAIPGGDVVRSTGAGLVTATAVRSGTTYTGSSFVAAAPAGAAAHPAGTLVRRSG